MFDISVGQHFKIKSPLGVGQTLSSRLAPDAISLCLFRCELDNNDGAPELFVPIMGPTVDELINSAPRSLRAVGPYYSQRVLHGAMKP